MTASTHGPRCTAHSSRTGESCKLPPVHGAVVCVVHGGRAPQVKRAAEDRIREMVDPALNQLIRIVNSGESDAVRLAAVKDVLDRAGYAPRQRVEIEVRQHAERLAAELGLDVAEVLAEAERLVGAHGN